MCKNNTKMFKVCKNTERMSSQLYRFFCNAQGSAEVVYRRLVREMKQGAIQTYGNFVYGNDCQRQLDERPYEDKAVTSSH